MLAKMGWTEGQKLGKGEGGLSEPVSPTTYRFWPFFFFVGDYHQIFSQMEI